MCLLQLDTVPYFARTKTVLFCLLILAMEHFQKAASIQCHKCEKKSGGSCDDGNCTGTTCVLVEAVSSQYRSVKKACSKNVHAKSECYVAYPDGIESVHCYCIYDWCNSDEEIRKSGLVKVRVDAKLEQQQANVLSNSVSDNGGGGTDRSKRTNSENSRFLSISTNSVVLLTFLCFFISAAFSLLIIHTMC